MPYDDWWHSQPVGNNPLWLTFRTENDKGRICDKMKEVGFGVKSHGMPQDLPKDSDIYYQDTAGK